MPTYTLEQDGSISKVSAVDVQNLKKQIREYNAMINDWQGKVQELKAKRDALKAELTAIKLDVPTFDETVT